MASNRSSPVAATILWPRSEPSERPPKGGLQKCRNGQDTAGPLTVHVKWPVVLTFHQT